MTMMIGTVSEGTLKSRDLLEAFYPLLEEHASAADEHHLLVEIDEALANKDDDEEYLAELFGEMLDILNTHTPPYIYAGALESDPACYGVWVDWEALDYANDVLKVKNLEEVPPSHDGLVFCGTEDGGSLYDVRNGNVVRHYWSV